MLTPLTQVDHALDSLMEALDNGATVIPQERLRLRPRCADRRASTAQIASVVCLLWLPVITTGCLLGDRGYTLYVEIPHGNRIFDEPADMEMRWTTNRITASEIRMWTSDDPVKESWKLARMAQSVRSVESDAETVQTWRIDGIWPSVALISNLIHPLPTDPRGLLIQVVSGPTNVTWFVTVTDVERNLHTLHRLETGSEPLRTGAAVGHWQLVQSDDGWWSHWRLVP